MDFLRKLFTEPLNYEAFAEAVKKAGINLVDVSDGAYIPRAKYNDAIKEKKALEDSIKTLNSDIETLKNENAKAEDYRKKFDELQQKVTEAQEKTQREQEEAQLEAEISTIFGDKKFLNDYTRAGIISEMKAEIAKPENQSKTKAEIFADITKDRDGIFQNPNQLANMGGINPINGFNSNTDDMSDEEYYSSLPQFKNLT